MADDDGRIVALTHTALRDRHRRLWSFQDIALPGLSIPGLQAGGAVFAVLLVTGWLLHALIGGATFMVVFIFTIVASTSTYFVWGKSITGVGGADMSILFWADYRFVQPRVIHGSGANRQPTRLRWEVTFWEPTDPGWIARRDATYQWLIDHAPAGTATAADRAPQDAGAAHSSHLSGGNPS